MCSELQSLQDNSRRESYCTRIWCVGFSETCGWPLWPQNAGLDGLWSDLARLLLVAHLWSGYAFQGVFLHAPDKVAQMPVVWIQEMMPVFYLFGFWLVEVSLHLGCANVGQLPKYSVYCCGGDTSKTPSIATGGPNQGEKMWGVFRAPEGPFPCRFVFLSNYAFVYPETESPHEFPQTEKTTACYFQRDSRFIPCKRHKHILSPKSLGTHIDSLPNCCWYGKSTLWHFSPSCQRRKSGKLYLHLTPSN